MNNVENVVINSKQELYDYLHNFNFKTYKDTDMSSVYFLVEYNECVEPLHFMFFEDVWFEAPCTLGRFPLKDEDVTEFVKATYYEESFEDALEYEKRFQIDGTHYVIDCFQCIPFLPEKCKIIKPMTEMECLKWLMDKYISSEKDD